MYKVTDGTAQLGITGLDVIREHPHEDLIVIHDKLGFGQCKLLIAVPESWVDVEHMLDLLDVADDFREKRRRNLRVVTKYPYLTRQFFHAEGLRHFTVVKAEGAIEAAPTIGYADIVVDLTQTGTTLRENHLKPLAGGIIVDSQACLVGNRPFLRENRLVLETTRTLLEYIDAALQGREYYQITINIKGKDAASIAEQVASNSLTSGLLGPTVSPVFSANIPDNPNGIWHTVTVVVRQQNLMQAVEHLRAIGGAQVVTVPVRYIFLEQSPTYTQLLEELGLTL
jgi:ATP phosphoribosyltransferase